MDIPTFEIDIKNLNISKKLYECESTELIDKECLLFNYFPKYNIEEKKYNIFNDIVIDRYNKILTDRKSCFTFLLYDISEDVKFTFQHLGNVISIIKQYEKYIDNVEVKMFYRIYIDISTFLTNIDTENKKYVLSMFDYLLETGLVEIHQIKYPDIINIGHMKRVIRFLPFLDSDIEYFYSKDIDGIFSDNDINLINTITKINAMTDDEYITSRSNFELLFGAEKKISKYQMAFFPIYQNNCAHWLVKLYEYLLTEKELEYNYYCKPAGLFITNLKLSEADFNKYFNESINIFKNLKLENTFFDEIFLNYTTYKEKEKNTYDINNLLIYPDISNPENENIEMLNKFTYNIQIKDYKLIFSKQNIFYKKYLKYKQKYMNLKKY